MGLMLENNRLWLEQANPSLLKSYEEQPEQEPNLDAQQIRCLTMTHQDAKSSQALDYISPNFYQKQKDNLDSIEESEPSEQIRLCIVGGTDGGHLLNYVNDAQDIKHLIVIEKDYQSFFHSLSVFDWPSMFQKFEQKGGTIYFHIGAVTPQIKNRLTSHIQEIGIYNAGHIFFAHDNSDKGKLSVLDCTECLQGVINSLGFYDDERVGLAHSLHKLENNARFLMETPKPWIDTPVVVCGNGPSLSKNLTQIKKNRKFMFLVSCGTAIGTLYRAGIKPDFHIEQERPKVSSNWTKLTTTPDFRKGITCIGLNVIHPQTHELFEDIAYAVKSNDFGGMFTSESIGAPPLMFVNPLAGNAGASIMTNLGFKHVYLVGADCSVSRDGACHAKGHKVVKKIEANQKVRGNFRKEVDTNQLYIDSRNVYEALIRSNPRTQFYNLGDGAYIAGARPVKKFSPRGLPKANKTQIMAPFRACDIDVKKDEVRRMILAGMFGLRQMIKSIPEKVKTKSEAYSYLDQIHNYLLDVKKSSPLFWYLVKGSFTTQLVFMSACANLSIDAFNGGVLILKDFSEEVHENMKNGLFDFSTFESNGGLPEDVNKQT